MRQGNQPLQPRRAERDSRNRQGRAGKEHRSYAGWRRRRAATPRMPSQSRPIPTRRTSSDRVRERVPPPVVQLEAEPLLGEREHDQVMEEVEHQRRAAEDHQPSGGQALDLDRVVREAEQAEDRAHAQEARDPARGPVVVDDEVALEGQREMERGAVRPVPDREHGQADEAGHGHAREVAGAPLGRCPGARRPSPGTARSTRWRSTATAGTRRRRSARARDDRAARPRCAGWRSRTARRTRARTPRGDSGPPAGAGPASGAGPG